MYKMLVSKSQCILAIGVTITVAAITLSFLIKQRRKSWKKVGKISKLFLHPVKSMRGLSVNGLVCTKQGMRSTEMEMFDRSFLLIQPNGNMMTARKEPRMVTVSIELGKDNVTLSAPNAESITVTLPTDESKGVQCKVWGEETLGLDCGNEVSKWLSTYLKSAYRLVYHAPKIVGRNIAARDKIRQPIFHGRGKLMYHDTSPGHLISEASIEDLNSRLANKVTIRNFRPNIVVNGCEPFGEDKWMHVKIGDAEFVYVRDTYRCVLTTVDPDTGTKYPDGNPLTTMRTYRKVAEQDLASFANSPPIGTSLAVVKEGLISVGDDVYAC